ncbi:hypothetical protein P152DRAFT_430637 [Eremomyces bilateralis CBS 781.70]|uniref:Pyridoxal phosphate homeostasis protein n=1 Tax=Eremomyces bilateralis CBS 781.70 TaxID=1392243 RepID=A0A6G1GA64_9PEZI|nr:uncharacterized protein P152DRAFT_430637 [Eremomyces bilateralis CBS 781.70]KAF1814729.1 hypothetical protein P152DRAFT_430637 [Eremomyces bilateralis CBS 781.70]
MASDMQINPQRTAQLSENIAQVLKSINRASKGKQVRLVAVSKLKPANDILALHTASSNPQSHFGENYVQELQEKAAILPRSIKWHFIGGLQTNKCKPLAERIPNLWCVSSVDEVKKADALEKGRAALANSPNAQKTENESKPEELDEKLRVLVQVNTSGERNKSGCEPSETPALCQHIISSCPHLRLSGLMTIGSIARSVATTLENENEDFITLRSTRDEVASKLGLKPEDLDLSMGMSSDYEGAIAMGSSEVRVGSTIFGERPPRKEAKVREDASESQPS